jgi:hypothetical protein
VEKPWIIRSSTSRIGAHRPIESYDGTRPTHSVAPDISRIVIARTCLRPRRSPSGPQTRPPSGRTRNETANVISASSVALSASPGKIAAEMYVTPYA